MQRALNISELWNWLPAFRVVGEYESIHRAALAMHVSPSALSRTIRLLEEAVGTPLFGRTSTGLVLTEFGKELLAVTREVMRRVDDVLEARHSHGSSTGRSVSASAASPMLLSLLGVAASRIYSAETTPRIRLGLVDGERMVEELLTGVIDLALVEAEAVPKLPDELVMDEIGALVFALHAPSSGAADRMPTTSVVALGDIALEGYEVVSTAASVEAAVAIATAGGALAFLPRPLAPAMLEVVAGTTSSVRIARVTRRPLGQASLPWLDGMSNAIRSILAT